MQSRTQRRKADPEGWGQQDVQAGRGALQQLARAMTAFFRRVQRGETLGFPWFKPHQRFQCIDLAEPRPGMVKRRGQHSRMTRKGGPVITIRPTRPLPESTGLKRRRHIRRPTGCPVDLVDAGAKRPLPAGQQAVGLDMGVRKSMTLSTGEPIARTRPDDAAMRAQQQAVSRCKKDSHTRQKQSKQLARLRRRQAIQKRNACHSLPPALVTSSGRLAVENRASPPLTKTGTHPHTFNKSITEQTGGRLRQQLTDKAAGAGREGGAVPPAFPSQDGSQGGGRTDPGTSERYQGPSCGLRIDRDKNAALNSLRAGTFALAARQNGRLCD